VPITAAVQPLPEGRALCTKDGEPAVPAGYFGRCDSDYWVGSDGCAVVSLADLREARHHPSPGRHNGCCGRDGGDGPNLICPAGHEIGTERSDCWMAHGAVLLAGCGVAKG
jgi:hypothetical protein